MRIATVFAAALGLFLLAGAGVQAQETSYAPWQGQPQTGDMMPDLLKTLRALTDKADRDKAANPVFLADLRRVISDYDTRYRWPLGLLFDDFHDGEFANNPAWHVVSGEWQVTNRGGVNALFSTIRNDSGYGQQSNSGNSGDIVANILGALLNQQNGQGQGQSGQYQSNQNQIDPYQPDQNQSGSYQSSQNHQGRDTSASIVAPVAISDQFYIRLDIVSRHGRQFSFGPYAGRRAQDSYQVTYVSGAANGLVLLRVTDRGSQVLGQSRGPINLEDNQSHLLEWTRGPAGKMTVILDGRPSIEATDPGLRSPFGGFLMINSGGTFGVRSVAINGTRQ
jgi:hypothetical protein